MILERLTLTRYGTRAPGDPCPRSKCSGRLVVYKTFSNAEEGSKTQYLECNACHLKPEGNKNVITSTGNKITPPRS